MEVFWIEQLGYFGSRKTMFFLGAFSLFSFTILPDLLLFLLFVLGVLK